MSNIHPTAIVDSKAEIGEDVEIGPYSVVGPDLKIGAGTKVMSHVVLDGRTTIGKRCNIFPFASIGTQTQDLKFAGGKTYVEIGDETTIREYVTVNSGTNEGDITRVGSNCHIMAYVHVAHQCSIGNEVIMSNLATLAGHVIVEDHAVVAGMCGVHQFVRIGRLSFCGGCSKIVQDVPPFMMADGNPATIHGLNVVGLQRRNVSSEARSILKKAYRILFRQDLSTSQAVETMDRELESCEELSLLVDFIRGSERGIVKAPSKTHST